MPTKITTKDGKGKDARSLTVEFELGDKNGKADLAGLRKEFGDEVVAAHARSSIVVALQGFVRGQMKPDKDGKAPNDKEITNAVGKWKPGIRAPGKTKVERAAEAAASMTDAEKAELLKLLQG